MKTREYIPIYPSIAFSSVHFLLLPSFQHETAWRENFSQSRAVLPRDQVISLPLFYASYRFSNWKTRERWFLSVLWSLSAADLLLPALRGRVRGLVADKGRRCVCSQTLYSTLYLTYNPKHVLQCRQRPVPRLEFLAEAKPGLRVYMQLAGNNWRIGFEGDGVHEGRNIAGWPIGP